MKRRHLIAAVGASTLPLAGCLDGTLGQPTDDGNGENGGDGEDDLDGEIETTGSDCAAPEDDWAVAFRADDTVTVEGVTPAPDPCHEATLESIERDGDTLDVLIDVAEDLGEDEDCAMCAGAVSYRVTIDAADDADRVRVVHESGENHERVIYDEDDSMDVDTTEIETTSKEPGVDEQVAVAQSGLTVVIDGTTPAPTPCHEATIVDAYMEGDDLHVEIGVVEDDVDACTPTIAGISYQAIVELTGPPRLGDVWVHHEEGGTHTIADEESD